MGYSPKVVNTPKDDKSSWSFTTDESNALLEKGWKEYEKAFAYVDEGTEKIHQKRKKAIIFHIIN